MMTSSNGGNGHCRGGGGGDRHAGTTTPAVSAGTNMMSSAAAMHSLAANGALAAPRTSDQGSGELKQLLELESEEDEVCGY